MVRIANLVCAGIAALDVLLLAPNPAHAAWTRVETDRFVVYGERREDEIRAYATKLTTFDSILRLLNPGASARLPYRKLELYLVGSSAAVRRIAPYRATNVRGFYAATVDGVFAVVADVALDADRDDVIFHEYAHHFMQENFPAAYPAWFVEGWAEYYATAEIKTKSIKIGGYNEDRAYWLFNAPWTPMEDVLTKTPTEIRKGQRHLYYGQAWLLMHYMRSTPERAAQLNQATQAIAKGEDPLKALQAATGMDVAQLTAALRTYSKLPIVTFDNTAQPPAMTVTSITRGEGEFLLDHLRLNLASRRPDPVMLADIRRRAALYPGDRGADLILARTEVLIGDLAAGLAILDCRLKATPDDVEALRLAGVSRVIGGYREPARQVELFRAARPLLAKAYKVDGRDFRTLYFYAASRLVEPEFPTENDLTALIEARAMAPNVQLVAIFAGSALLQRGDKARAEKILRPVVNSPHGGPLAEQARALLAGKSLAESEQVMREAPAEIPPEPESDTPSSDAP